MDNNIEQLFDKEVVENISNLVEEKMKILNKVKDFEEKDKKLSNIMEELDEKLPEELREQFDDVIRLTYQVEEYYFALAYFLGSKYSEQLGNL